MNPTLAGALVWCGAGAWWAYVLASDLALSPWFTYVLPVGLAWVLLRVFVREP